VFGEASREIFSLWIHADYGSNRCILDSFMPEERVEMNGELFFAGIWKENMNGCPS